MGKNPESAVTRESVLGVQGSSIESLSGLKEVRRLDGLIQAHTLLAVMSGMNSHEHQLHLLRAHTFVLQVWQVNSSRASFSFSCARIRNAEDYVVCLPSGFYGRDV